MSDLPFDPEYDQPSKTRRKQEAHDMQELGEQLMPLKRKQLERLNLPERVVDALLESQRLTERGAIKRQKQYIGKLMRDLDPEPIREFLSTLRATSDRHNAWLHRLERLRDTLIADDSALAAFIAEHPEAPVQSMRQAIRNAKAEQAAGKPPKAYRQLFQLLKEVIAEPAAPRLADEDEDETNED